MENFKQKLYVAKTIYYFLMYITYFSKVEKKITVSCLIFFFFNGRNHVIMLSKVSFHKSSAVILNFRKKSRPN